MLVKSSCIIKMDVLIMQELFTNINIHGDLYYWRRTRAFQNCMLESLYTVMNVALSKMFFKSLERINDCIMNDRYVF